MERGEIGETVGREGGGAEDGNAQKIAPKHNIFGIWGHPLGATAPCRTFLENFSGRTFPSQIVCLYLEPFKGNKASNLTILKMSLQKFNVFGIIVDTAGGWATARCHTLLESSFHAQRLPRR